MEITLKLIRLEFYSMLKKAQEDVDVWQLLWSKELTWPSDHIPVLLRSIPPA